MSEATSGRFLTQPSHSSLRMVNGLSRIWRSSPTMKCWLRRRGGRAAQRLGQVDHGGGRSLHAPCDECRRVDRLGLGMDRARPASARQRSGGSPHLWIALVGLPSTGKTPHARGPRSDANNRARGEGTSSRNARSTRGRPRAKAYEEVAERDPRRRPRRQSAQEPPRLSRRQRCRRSGCGRWTRAPGAARLLSEQSRAPLHARRAAGWLSALMTDTVATAPIARFTMRRGMAVCSSPIG